MTSQEFIDKWKPKTEEPKGMTSKEFIKKWKGNTLDNPKWKPKNEEVLQETLPPSASASDYIHDFVHSKNKVFKGDTKKKRIKRALGAYYDKKRSG